MTHRAFLFLLIVSFAAPSADAATGIMQPDAQQALSFGQGLHVVITGSGSALPDPERGGASAAVIVDGAVLQFDFGRRVMDNLMLAGINPVDIDYVFFTHHHFDHIATYDYYMIANWIAGRQERVLVLGPEGTEQMTRDALEMHDSDRAFVEFIVDNWPESVATRPSRQPPYEARDVDPGIVLQTEIFKVTAASTPHYPANMRRSLAYRVDTPYGTVVVTGDTGYSDAVIELSRDADLLIHEAQKPDPGMVSGGKMSGPEFQEPDSDPHRPQTHHTSPTELGIIAEKAKVKKVIAYHLPPFTSVAKAVEMTSLYTGAAPGFQIWGEYINAIKKNYSGPVILAEDAMIITVGEK